MKVVLNIAAASKVLNMSHCSRSYEADCGINYRSM